MPYAVGWTDEVYEKTVAPFFGNFSKAAPASRITRQPPDFYFGHDHFQTLRFPFEFSLDWESFLGTLLSSAWTPDEDGPKFGAFASNTGRVFDRLSINGRLVSTGETELILGQVATF